MSAGRGLADRLRRDPRALAGGLVILGAIACAAAAALVTGPPTPLEEIATRDGLALADLEAALKAVQNCEPAGVGARSLQECLLLQLESRSAKRLTLGVELRVVLLPSCQHMG